MKKFGQNTFTSLLLRLLLVYVLLFLCRVVFFWMNTGSLGSIDSGEFGSLLQGALVFDTVSMLYANAVFIFFSLFPFRVRERKWYGKCLFWLYVVTNGLLVVVLNLVDGLYFHYVKKRITAEDMHFAGNDNTGRLILQFTLENWYLLLCAVALIWGMVWVYRRIPDWKLPLRRPLAYTGVSLCLLGVAAGLAVAGVRGGFNRQVRPLAMNNAGQYATNHRKASLILSNPFCVIRTLGGTRIEVPQYYSAEELEAIFTPYHDPQPDSTALGKRNVVLFTLESFSAEHSAFLQPDLYPDGRGYTPFLDSLMAHGYAFMNAFSNGRKSIEALPSLLASIPSYKKPFVLLPQSLGEMRGLPGLLADEGYATSFFCGSQYNSMGFSAFASLAGIRNIHMQEAYEEVHGRNDFDGFWGIWDEPFLQYVGETLNGYSEPFFSCIFTVSSHHPFEIPVKYEDVFPKGTTKMHRPVQYTDMAIRRFFEHARQQEWFENTIFVFSADHVSSEIFAEKSENPTGNSHIIMFIYTPDGALAGKDYRTAQQLDIMPTILGLTGYDKPYFAFGRDVFREPERVPVATNYFNESFQYISDSIVLFSDMTKTLFAYERTDTLQRRDIKAEHTPVQQEGERLLKAILQQYYTHLNERSYIGRNRRD